MAAWKNTFVSKRLTTVQTKLMLHSLYALPVAVLEIPANSAARSNNAKNAKHVIDYFSLVYVLTCTHLH